MNLSNRLVQFVKRYGKDFLRKAVAASEKQLRKNSAAKQRTQRDSSGSHAFFEAKFASNLQQNPAAGAAQRNRGRNVFNATDLPAPDAPPVKWNLAKFGLPRLSYTPDNDNLPDPGEVVWTWVPYEEMDGRGKDRPVLVVSMHEEYIIFAQMTSKDHASGTLSQDKFDRWWLDIGTGTWDRAGRPSEARLDLLWVVHASQVRRIGGKLDAATYHKLAQALQKIHGMNG